MNVNVAEELERLDELSREVLAALDVLRPGDNSHRQSALLALYHVLGLQMYNALMQGGGLRHYVSIVIEFSGRGCVGGNS